MLIKSSLHVHKLCMYNQEKCAKDGIQFILLIIDLTE